MAASVSARKMLRAAGSFAKRHIVMIIAAAAALVSAFFIPPDAGYFAYFDWKTLACLFCTLAVVCALRNIRFFERIAETLARAGGSLRTLALILITVTFVGSMLIANDMALITFLPLGYFSLRATKTERYAAFLFILQNIAANLGGMLTPFGNPQNLYLYSFFQIPTGEFLQIMVLPFLLSVSALALCCLFFPKVKLQTEKEERPPMDRMRMIVYLVLFAFSIAVVFRVLPYWTGPAVVLVFLLILDRKALKQVDYGLLLTFFFFFIFSGNLSRIPAVGDFFRSVLDRDPLLVSVLSCQCISNVPSAILLSRFTTDYPSLLLGVNIGGTGTLIASLASLITFNVYRSLYPKKTLGYFLLFTAVNAAFLVLLTLATRFAFLPLIRQWLAA